jgi:hypothetical protein
MTPQEFLHEEGTFTWLWNARFFVETRLGNFVWMSPSYEGDNTLTYTSKTYEEYLKDHHVPFGREKGVHEIGEYVGEQVIFTKATIALLSRMQ